MHSDFYKNGYETFKFDSIGIEKILKEIMDGKLKKDFSLQGKYANTLDLRPNVFDYSNDFLTVLKKNNIKDFLRSRTLKDLTLYHIQIRKTETTKSYLDWHRDSYFNNNEKNGFTPPGIKLIYYPNFSKDVESRLFVIPGSHRFMNDNVQEDIKYAKSKPHVEIQARNDQAVIFEPSLYHCTVPDKTKSIRIIYAFIAREQIGPENNNNMHFVTSKKYEEMF